MLCLCYPVASNDRGHSPSVQGQRHSLEKQSPSTKTLCVCVPSRLRRDGGFCCPPLRGWQYRRTVSIPPSAKSQTSCTATLDTQCPRTIAPSARCGFPPPSPKERAVQMEYVPVPSRLRAHSVPVPSRLRAHSVPVPSRLRRDGGYPPPSPAGMAVQEDCVLSVCPVSLFLALWFVGLFL